MIWIFWMRLKADQIVPSVMGVGQLKKARL